MGGTRLAALYKPGNSAMSFMIVCGGTYSGSVSKATSRVCYYVVGVYAARGRKLSKHSTGPWQHRVS